MAESISFHDATEFTEATKSSFDDHIDIAIIRNLVDPMRLPEQVTNLLDREICLEQGSSRIDIARGNQLQKALGSMIGGFAAAQEIVQTNMGQIAHDASAQFLMHPLWHRFGQRRSTDAFHFDPRTTIHVVSIDTTRSEDRLTPSARIAAEKRDVTDEPLSHETMVERAHTSDWTPPANPQWAYIYPGDAVFMAWGTFHHVEALREDREALLLSSRYITPEGLEDLKPTSYHKHFPYERK